MKPASGPVPWVVVAGGVHRQGGTDKANLALVEYLSERDIPVHVVTLRADPGLFRRPTVHVSLVRRPAGSDLAGERLLSLRGRLMARRVTAVDPRARVLVNGGNCVWSDINWVHYVHRVWSAQDLDAPWKDRIKHRVAVAASRRREELSLRAARLVVANSELTRRHLIDLIHVEPSRVHTLYLGSESDWAPASNLERATARGWLDEGGDGKPLIVFLGAVGYDQRKGLDILLAAWQRLCLQPEWDANLIVAGDGRALPQWIKKVAQSELRDRVRFLGFTEKVPELLAAADLVVSPARYESYGLNVQEALCRGVPTIVSAGSGVAERYPSYLRDLLLPDPEDVDDLVRRMLLWRANRGQWRERVAGFCQELRRYSWHNMAERFFALATDLGEIPSASLVSARIQPKLG